MNKFRVFNRGRREQPTCDRLTSMLMLATTDKNKTQKQKEEEARPPAGQPGGCPKGDRQPTAAGRKPARPLFNRLLRSRKRPARPRFLKQVGL